jgi:hypothetical protein
MPNQIKFILIHIIIQINAYYLPGGQITQTLILVFLAPKSESRNVHKSHAGDLPPATFWDLLVGWEG